MLDDLRQQAEPESEEPVDAFTMKEEPPRRPRNFLGMTPIQRLVLAVMFFAMTCVMAVFALIVLEKIYLPF